MSERILRFKATCVKVGYSRTALYEALKAGRFVKPRQLGPRAIGFLESEVDHWLLSRPVANPEIHHIGHVSKRRKALRDVHLPEASSSTAKTA
jgi:prophage regulatory protein